MGSTKISLNDEAYRILKSQKREDESFSELILRVFKKGDPVALLSYLEGHESNLDLADSVEAANRRSQLRV